MLATYNIPDHQDIEIQHALALLLFHPHLSHIPEISADSFRKVKPFIWQFFLIIQGKEIKCL